MKSWTAEICPKTGEVIGLNRLNGKTLKMKEPVVIRGSASISVIVNAKTIMQAHDKTKKATKQLTVYEGI